MEVLFTLLADRYEQGSVMLTGILPFSIWNEIFKDPTTTAVAIGRNPYNIPPQVRSSGKPPLKCEFLAKGGIPEGESRGYRHPPVR